MKALLKSAYHLLPFKRQIFSLLKTFWQPGERLYRHLHFKGVIDVKIDGRKFKMYHHGYQVENDIFWAGLGGNWEKHSLLIWSDLAKKSSVILDVGANTGVYSLIASAVNPEAKIFAFEPVARVFEKLQRNANLNRFAINCLPLAASDRKGEASIYDNGEEHQYAASLNSDTGNSLRPSATIQTITLDEFVNTHGLTNIDLVKIDVEYHEPQAIAGFLNSLKSFKPSLLIEILSAEVGQKVEEQLKGIGYIFFSVNEKTGLVQTDHLKPHDGFNYLICTEVVAESLHLRFKSPLETSVS